ncbi:hypothetical protein WICPIJ_008807 [Wickerhamomyces pijperi]|uniref:Uncharacterized protein n=1 Tax=Wickerhamomyces pijperi TaxID=599730 RepID=A0A9P8PWH1_WICPI|nr:hypothetical protein WICPIJ_008807 [Wickerhamomyces pijperi]
MDLGFKIGAGILVRRLLGICPNSNTCAINLSNAKNPPISKLTISLKIFSNNSIVVWGNLKLFFKNLKTSATLIIVEPLRTTISLYQRRYVFDSSGVSCAFVRDNGAIRSSYSSTGSTPLVVGLV